MVRPGERARETGYRVRVAARDCGAAQGCDQVVWEEQKAEQAGREGFLGDPALAGPDARVGVPPLPARVLQSGEMYVIRPWLMVGKLRDTLHADVLREQGVGAMLQLCCAVPQSGIASLFLDVEDGETLPEGALARGVSFVRAQKADGKNVLVACGAGISRSVSFAIASLHEEEGVGLLDAYRQVRRVHPDARPHPILWRCLCAHYGDDVPFVDLFRKVA